MNSHPPFVFARSPRFADPSRSARRRAGRRPKRGTGRATPPPVAVGHAAANSLEPPIEKAEYVSVVTGGESIRRKIIDHPSRRTPTSYGPSPPPLGTQPPPDQKCRGELSRRGLETTRDPMCSSLLWNEEGRRMRIGGIGKEEAWTKRVEWR
ncbi:hypothetical protein KM043_002313 [Ampulex compressa]|nr:hypothetical protein KM043_002313 [Ampulex compressa]